MKDLFPGNKQSKKRIRDSLNKKGFYVILLLGVVVIGITIIWITKPNLGLFNFITNTDENFIPDDFEEYLPDYDVDEEIGEDEAVNVNNEAGGEDKTGGEDRADEVDEADWMDEIDWEDKAGGNDKIDGKDIGLAINPGESTNTGEDAYTGKEGAAIDTSDVFGAGPGIASEEQKLTLEEGSSISYDDDEDEDAVFLVENDEENNSRVSLDDEASKPDFIMPVYGNIIHDYAMDKLVYSKTLEDWRTHGGIDIAASRGTAVKAVAGGVVYEIRSDPRLGYTIVIDHENGFKTVYANLASPDMVLPNQIVEQGDSIGSVGDTAVFEIALEPHLHFEVLKNDELVDPKLYLPEY